MKSSAFTAVCLVFMSSIAMANTTVTQASYGRRAKNLITALQMLPNLGTKLGNGNYAYVLHGLLCVGSGRYADDLSNPEFSINEIRYCSNETQAITQDPGVGAEIVRALAEFGVPYEGAAGSYSLNADVTCQVHIRHENPLQRFGCRVTYTQI